jgi:hypothetical protein
MVCLGLARGKTIFIQNLIRPGVGLKGEPTPGRIRRRVPSPATKPQQRGGHAKLSKKEVKINFIFQNLDLNIESWFFYI